MQASHAAQDNPQTGGRRPRSKGVLVTLAVIAALLFSGFVALGTWQVKRLSWKLDLIARVDQRAHAPAVALPAQSEWAGINAANDEYRRVQATGVFLHDRETLVQAVSDLGSGFWVMTPLQLADGTTLLVNRGFVSQERRDRSTRSANEPKGETSVTGLLRITQPKGGFLRSNEPGADRWYSRDVAAIAAARGLSNIAPYFVDADTVPVLAQQKPAEPRLAEARMVESKQAETVWPVGGLTVIDFQNNHLVYAVTWYLLALMVAGVTWYVARYERRERGTR
ncbi:SURF1 family protein [Pigmentiphaga aceris]|uniref:SURF1-like protein n=1 Tax=Pigmentiphaga aceris TaxID=1940612 RepID=A0A5C0AVW9_9BURK|nr:SURF1 family protein [Pigmentiphaga aceris]QEI06519.1 SURF1 family protein [Pigmentiphaga aceris]